MIFYIVYKSVIKALHQMKDKEFKQLVWHYFRIAFERAGVPRRQILQNDKGEIYKEEEWNKLSEVSGIEKNKIKKWRSEYTHFLNAFEALKELSNLGQFKDLIEFMHVFFRKEINVKEDENETEDIKSQYWSNRLKNDMESLNYNDTDHRIKLSSFISFICHIENYELRDEIIETIIVLTNKIDKKKTTIDQLLSLIKLFKHAIE